MACCFLLLIQHHILLLLLLLFWEMYLHLPLWVLLLLLFFLFRWCITSSSALVGPVAAADIFLSSVDCHIRSLFTLLLWVHLLHGFCQLLTWSWSCMTHAYRKRKAHEGWLYTFYKPWWHLVHFLQILMTPTFCQFCKLWWHLLFANTDMTRVGKYKQACNLQTLMTPTFCQFYKLWWRLLFANSDVSRVEKSE